MAVERKSMTKTDIAFTPLGGGQEIGANCYLLNFGGGQIILDSGVHPQKMAYDALPAIERVSGKVSAIIITHAHQDHIGSLPVLHRRFPDAEIYMTEATLKIARIMFSDTYKLFTRMGLGSGMPKFFFHSLYERDNIRSLAEKVRAVNAFNTFFKLTENLSCMFFDAGHIAGSCGVVLTDGAHKVVYTGDICFQPQETLNGCDADSIQHFKNPELLICESTYGADTEAEHISRDNEKQRMYNEMFRVISNNGSILFPAFALGKTQELMLMCHEFLQNYEIFHRVPIIVAGLGTKINKVYGELLTDEEKKTALSRIEYKNFNFLNILHRYKKESNIAQNVILPESTFRALIDDEITRILRKPSLIIATSGMLIPDSLAGRFARQILPKHHHAVFFTGYVAPFSFGASVQKLREGALLKFSDGEPLITNQCENIKKFRFASHAYRRDLLSFVRRVRPKNALLVHGDRDAVRWLETEAKSSCNAVSPKNGETLYLNLKTNELRRTSHMRAIITTVGTSLITNYNMDIRKQTASPQDITGITKHDLVHYLRETSLSRASAETNTLNRIGLKKDDYLYFICTDTPSCTLCGEAFEEYYSGNTELSCFAESKIVSELVDDVNIFQSAGIINFINGIADIAEKYEEGNVIICATGGYKVEIAYATLLGILLNAPVYYIHEDFKSLMALPHLPVSFNFDIFGAYNNQINEILNAPSAEDARKLANKLPKQMHIMFVEDKGLSRFRFSPIGTAYHRAFQYHKKHAEKTDIPLRVYKNHSTLWGNGIQSVSDINDRDIRRILNRVAKTGLVTGFYLDEMKNGKTSETHFEFKNKLPGALRYLIHTPSGSEYIKIETSKGMEEYLLEILGAKIYP